MYLVSFDSSDQIFEKGYRGNAGRKIAVLHDGDLWLLKFPESTKNFPGRQKPNNHLPSYTTSPVSEYIGSKIYASLGIPVHDVMLGHREGKLVVACRDFAVGAELLEFSQIKNMIDEDMLEGGNSSDRRGELLSDALRVIDKAGVFNGGLREQVRQRFWDMFVTDAFILNNDRNNGNWGLLVGRYKTELAPVYDNGNALYNKRSDSLMEARLGNERAIENDADQSVSFYLDQNGRHIHPFKYIEAMADEDCNAAVLRFAERLDMGKVDAILDELPEQECGITIMPAATKVFYKGLLHEIAETRLLPCAEKIREFRGISCPQRAQGCDLDVEERDARGVSGAMDAPTGEVSRSNVER